MNIGAIRGFSFIELLASLAIMAVLLLIAVPSAQVAVQRHREVELRTALAQIRGAIDQYKKASEQGRILVEAGESGYPPNLLVLTEGVMDISSPKRSKMYFLRKFPREPFYRGQARANAETWGLRSYQSPPDDPSEGDDVFDVFSMSERVGLNDIPYREW